jgi:RNA polymerase sigma-70 factor (ECF subfamily)
VDDVGVDLQAKLAAEMAWVRRLARALVKDDAAADDVAQDAWLVAARRLPDDGRPLKPWLSRVVLNLVRMRGRSATRRHRYEQREPAEISPATPEELVERVQLQRVVSGEVLALAEPYRSTVLLHFVEDLSSAEIARRLGIPDGTVRRRLKVALDQLRERLAARDDRPNRGWLAALVPIAETPQTPWTLAGVIAMNKLVAAVVVVLIVLLAGLAWWWTRGDDTRREVATTTAPSSTPGSIRPETARVPDWLAQPNVAGRRIAGRVVFAGAPVKHAGVKLGVVAPGTVQATGETQTDDAGHFDFGIRGASTYAVSAESAGLTPASTIVAVADPRSKPDAIVLELTACRSRLIGSVIDASGGSIAKARLRVNGLGGADADGTGHFSLCVPPGNSQIRVEADGYGSVDLPVRIYGELHHDFELVPEAAIVGQVVDEAHHGVPDARVVAIPILAERPHDVADGWTMTDGDGRFRITRLVPATFDVSAIAPGAGTSTPRRAVSTNTPGHDVVLIVEPRARVSGRVMMAGKPIAGARVAVAEPDLVASTSFSQADGSFVLDGVRRGKHAMAAPPYHVITPASLDVDRSKLDGVTLEVEAMGTIRGHVTRHGKPVPNANVVCSDGSSTTSDANGAFQFEGVPPGNATLSADESYGVKAFALSLHVVVANGEVATADIELTGGANVRGVVVDEAGTPVPNVFVNMLIADASGDAGQSMTDARGEFECIEMLGGADYNVSVYPTPAGGVPFAAATGDRLPPVHVDNGDTEITGIRLAIKHDVVSIRGHVTDDTGGAVADVHVEAIGQIGLSNFLPSVRADANGGFEIGGLARGVYSLHAHAGDGSEVEVSGITAGATNVELRLVHPGAIDGQLVGFTTPPRVTGVMMSANLFMGHDAIVDGDHFTLSGLPPGKYTVEASGTESDGQTVQVQASSTAHVTLTGRGRGSVEGRVTDMTTKAPVPGMQCLAPLAIGGVAGQPQGPPVMTDADGHFVVDAPLGHARVMCFPDSPSTSGAGGDVEVTANSRAHVDLVVVRARPPQGESGFQLFPLTIPVVVRLVDPNGPAGQSGLVAGDHPTAIDGTPVANLLPNTVAVIAANHAPGTPFTITVDRAGVPTTFRIIAGKPAN